LNPRAVWKIWVLFEPSRSMKKSESCSNPPYIRRRRPASPSYGCSGRMGSPHRMKKYESYLNPQSSMKKSEACVSIPRVLRQGRHATRAAGAAPPCCEPAARRRRQTPASTRQEAHGACMATAAQQIRDSCSAATIAEITPPSPPFPAALQQRSPPGSRLLLHTSIPRDSADSDAHRNSLTRMPTLGYSTHRKALTRIQR
jgi:hypothetical protein